MVTEVFLVVMVTRVLFKATKYRTTGRLCSDCVQDMFTDILVIDDSETFGAMRPAIRKSLYPNMHT